MAYDVEVDPKTVPVPDVNGTNNNYLQEVVGNRLDKSFSNGISTPTLAGHLRAGYYHVHDSAKVWPTGAGNYGANPIQLTAGNEAWLHGTKVEVVPAVSGIDKWFDIHWIIASNASDADDYEIRVFSGPVETLVLIGSVAFTRNSVQDRSAAYVPIQIPPQPASKRISMSLACKAAAQRTVEVKIFYHTYPDIE